MFRFFCSVIIIIVIFKNIKTSSFPALAELLIVVAIIAVLVAISIPIFSSQLEKARDAVTVSNLRAAYAEAQTSYLTNSGATTAVTEGDVTYTPSATAPTVEVAHVFAKGVQAGYASNIDSELPFDAPAAMGGTAGKYTVKFIYDENGKITDVTATAE